MGIDAGSRGQTPRELRDEPGGMVMVSESPLRPIEPARDARPSVRAVAVEPTQPVRLASVPSAAPAPRRPEPPRELDGYQVLGRLARGGMGGVFLAREPRGRQLVALKVIDPELAVHPDIVARLRDELEVSRRVRHPGLVDIYSFAVSDDRVPYLVMEYLDGETLGALLDRGRLELGAASAIGAQVARAAAAMHAAGVVHCDLKPDNLHVLYRAGLAGWPEVKVLDFGVARIAGAAIEDEPSIAGTPAYMPPEQWRGAAVPGSDVYSLGCVMYELLVGAPPFCGTLPELMTAHFEALPLRPAVRRPGLRPELDGLVSRMLAKDPALRPRMRDVARTLTAMAEASPSPSWRGGSIGEAVLAAG